MSYRLGTNMGFAVNRYIEPEEWTRIVAEDLGLNYVQFVADLLNPSLPQEYIDSQIARIRNNIRHYNIKVESMFTSSFTRVNHLMHPDQDARKIWLSWFKRFLDMGARLGVRNAGSHFGILTVKSNDTPDLRKFLIEEAIKGWQELSFYAKDLGYQELIFEPMSIPREMGWTILETRELLAEVNAHAGIPMRLCLDVGHAPHPDERDPYQWIHSLAKDSPVIHLQQTERNRSNHWPFSEQYNKIGIIDAKKVMDAVQESGCTDALFAFEISAREHWDTDHTVISALKESVKYWRQYIEE